MEEAKVNNLPISLNSLPPELVEKILKLFTFKEISNIQLTCKRWKDIIVKGNLLKKASGKIFEPCEKAHFQYVLIPTISFVRENFCDNCCQR